MFIYRAGLRLSADEQDIFEIREYYKDDPVIFPNDDIRIYRLEVEEKDFYVLTEPGPENGIYRVEELYYIDYKTASAEAEEAGVDLYYIDIDISTADWQVTEE